jgi:ATP/maltotriose-dependent transcriptional regulator MalT
MAKPILATKLYIPRPRPNVVSRPRLLERLNEGLHRKLTLISAPAGFGKTTLVSEWVEGIERPTAWLSLDDQENDPARFLNYLVAALQTITSTLGEGVLGVLQSPQPPPIEAILTALLNEITTIPDHFVLVLDDYHVLDAKPIDQALTYLVEHLPPQMHLVIATREDPQLPLARLRARGHLTELRATDLRFTASEAAAFLNQVMSLSLSAADIAALEDRTEGWIAGLQLAALSLQGHQDVAGFIQAFAGDHRYIVDYLVAEVLQRQPAPVRTFLLQTAILDRLCGPLCDAVTGQEEGNARLEALERGNFFVVPLDDKRHWYRYHHLFAEVLSAHLLAEQPDQVSTLHRRASEWYEQHGSAADAIRHALEAFDFARAADLIELAVPAMRQSRQEATLLGWLKALSDELVQVRPVLSVAYAWALLAVGELEAAHARLRDAERWLDTTADMRERPESHSAEMVVVDEEEFRRLPGSIALVRAGQALARGDMPEAMTTYERALQWATAPGAPVLRGAADMYVGMSDLLREHNDLDAATQHLLSSQALGELAGLPQNPYRWRVAMARIRAAQDDLDGALDLLDQAERLYEADFSPNVRPVATWKTRVWVAQGRFGEALGWAREQGLEASDDLSYLREFEHITLARVLLARYPVDRTDRSIHGAVGLLERLLQAAQEGRRMGNVLEILLLQALAHQAQGDLPAALVPLERALTLAEPEGYVRSFVDEGSPMAVLLEEAAKHGIAPNYVRQLLAAFEAEKQQSENTSYPPPAQPLIEPLSPRELEVLHLIAQGLSNQEISERLFLALGTVKGHNQQIFGKLQVQRRTEAVARARELGLL